MILVDWLFNSAFFVLMIANQRYIYWLFFKDSKW